MYGYDKKEFIPYAEKRRLVYADGRTRDAVKNEGIGNGVAGHTGISWLFCLNSTMAGLKAQEVDAEEKDILRALARRVKELSELPVQEERRKLWDDHLCLKETRPVVFIDPEKAWYEIFPHTVLKCHNDLARVWELRLLKEIWWQENIGDDRVCRDTFSVQDIVTFSDFGLPKKKTGGGGNGAYHIDASIEDYDEDLPKLKFRELFHDAEKSARLRAIAEDTFDGILTVVRDNAWWYSAGLTVDAIELRGFENFLYDIYDYPDELKALMAFLRDDWLHMLSELEKHDLLSLNNGGEFMGTGGYGWCADLPKSADWDRDLAVGSRHVTPMDMWGYGESQESVSLSPDAFGEFVLPYQVPILEKFGLNSYGCCEPLDTRIDRIIDKVPRLRKVVVSPWSDAAFMAEKLKGNYAYCWKQNPAYIATPKINEDAIRKEIRDVFAVTAKHGCHVEILDRDILTLAWKPENAARWVQIAMEEAKKYE